MIKDYLELGQIVSTHGIKGEMRFNPWCDTPDFVKKFKTLYFDNTICYNSIELLCTGDKVEITRKLSSKNEK